MFQVVIAGTNRLSRRRPQPLQFSSGLSAKAELEFSISIRINGEETLAIATHSSDMTKAAAAFAQFRRLSWLIALLTGLISFFISEAALGDIYKWTDAEGRVNLSNVPPPAAGKAKDVELVLKEPTPGLAGQRVATHTEQALLARIEGLERQLQNRQYATQPPAPPPPVAPPVTPYDYYYPPAPSPPPSYYPNYYPSYYPSYSYPVASSYMIYPARSYVTRPVIVAPRSGFSHAGGGHGGHRGRR